jgi:phage replication O-like protein O
MNEELQIENGNYTQIVNKALDELVKAGLLGKELAITLFVIRKTWGYKKTSDIISLSQFCKATNTSRPTVVKTIKNLVAKNILVKTHLLGNKISFKFNKYYTYWLVKTPKLVKSKHSYSKDALTKTSKDALTHKRKKETNTKEILSSIDDEPFNPLEYINSLIASKQRHIHIIGLYWKVKKYQHPTKVAASEALKRDLKPAKQLCGYPDEALVGLMDWLECAKLDYEWKLTTIPKKIDDYLKETKTYEN